MTPYSTTDKNLYEGIFNWHGEVHELYRYARNTVQARKLMIRKLAFKLGLDEYHVSNYFSDDKDNCRITVIAKKARKKK